MPATVGGAVAMNAGTPDGGIADFISAVYFLHPDGTLGEFKPGGRRVQLPDVFAAPAGSVLIGARLQLHRRPFAEIQKEIKQRLKQKKATQPLALASAGCVWKNPPGETADPAHREGGPQGQAAERRGDLGQARQLHRQSRRAPRRADIKALMELTLDRVRNHFGITLEPEMKIMGEI